MKIHSKKDFNFEMKKFWNRILEGQLSKPRYPVWIKWKKQNINNPKYLFQQKHCFLLYEKYICIFLA